MREIAVFEAPEDTSCATPLTADKVAMACTDAPMLRGVIIVVAALFTLSIKASLTPVLYATLEGTPDQSTLASFRKSAADDASPSTPDPSKFSRLVASLANSASVDALASDGTLTYAEKSGAVPSEPSESVTVRESCSRLHDASPDAHPTLSVPWGSKVEMEATIEAMERNLTLPSASWYPNVYVSG